MTTTRYPQFCALARAAEVLGERWTLLIVRELLLGPKRFSDLRERLDGISPSVLTERLGRAEELGLVRRSVQPPPSASTVYELTAHGEALRPAVYELIRWGGRLLYPPRKGERIEPDWMRLALSAVARHGPSPSRSVLLRVRQGTKEAMVHVVGGPTGTVVTGTVGPADVTVVTDVKTLFAMIGGGLDPVAAARTGRIHAEGDRAALTDLPQLFDAQRSDAADHLAAPAGARARGRAR